MTVQCTVLALYCVHWESALILATLYSEEIRRPLQLRRISAVLSLADGLYTMVVETPHYTLQQWPGASSVLSTRSSLCLLSSLASSYIIYKFGPLFPTLPLQPLGFSLCPVKAAEACVSWHYLPAKVSLSWCRNHPEKDVQGPVNPRVFNCAQPCIVT